MGDLTVERLSPEGATIRLENIFGSKRILHHVNSHKLINDMYVDVEFDNMRRSVFCPIKPNALGLGSGIFGSVADQKPSIIELPLPTDIDTDIHFGNVLPWMKTSDDEHEVCPYIIATKWDIDNNYVIVILQDNEYWLDIGDKNRPRSCTLNGIINNSVVINVVTTDNEIITVLFKEHGLMTDIKSLNDSDDEVPDNVLRIDNVQLHYCDDYTKLLQVIVDKHSLNLGFPVNNANVIMGKSRFNGQPMIDIDLMIASKLNTNLELIFVHLKGTLDLSLSVEDETMFKAISAMQQDGDIIQDNEDICAILANIIITK